jgi:uncharacterized repeat protein (TIGR01451 family)
MGTSNWMTRAVALAAVAVAMAAVPARAQTPEGTVITNKAIVNYRDASGRLYLPDSASVSVTVGFKAGIDVTGPASVTPPSPSTGQSITYTVANIGNGTDNVQVSEAISNGAVITVTGYQINGAGTVYASVAALNTALLTQSLAGITGSLTVTVIYDVNAGQGGQSTTYTLTATSQRDNTMSDAASTIISPPAAYGVVVTPDGGVNRQRLPSGASTYTETFTVQNTGNADEAFDLLASSPGSVVIGIVTVNGVAGPPDSTRLTITTGASVNIDVTYTVAEVAVGSRDTLYLRARSVTQPATLDDGFVDLIVIRPRVTIAKQVYRDDQTTVIGPTDRVVPLEVIWYRVSVTNAGDQNATSVHVDDLLPAELTFLALANDGSPGWTLTNSGNDVDADLTVALAAGATRFFWIQARVN